MYNANNYGYNPYGRYMPQQPTQQQMPIVNENLTVQPVSNSYKLQGRQVESIEQAKLLEYPLDGSISYFVLTDGSCIVTKQLQNDGTSKVTVFKPVLGEKNEIKYITQEELKKAINGIDLSEIDDIKEELKDIKKQLKKKGVKDE